MNIGDSAAFEVDLDAALSSSYDKVMTPEPIEEKPITEDVAETIEEPEITDKGNEPEDKPAIEQPLTPHPRWSAEEKAAFSALPRDAQEFVLKRESDVEKNLTQKTQEIAEQRKSYESLENVLAPRRQELHKMGGEARVINELFQLSDYANRDPAGFIQYFAKNNGIDLGNFNKPAADEYIDPALQAQKQRLDSIEQKLTYQEQQAENALLVSIRSEIDKFQNEKDDKGAILRPYFNEVREEMRAFLQNFDNINLQEAYERAIYANPDIRSKIFAEQEKARAASTLNATKEAAAKAAKASGVQVKTKVPATSGKAKETWEETVENATNAHFDA